MKKIIALCLCVLLCLLCLAGCVDEKAKDGFFSQRTLNKFLIPNLPRIGNKSESTLRHNHFAFETTVAEFGEYVESVYDYLVSCSFKHLGYHSGVVREFWTDLRYYSFEYGTELSDFQFGELYYEFVWSNSGTEVDEQEGLLEILNANYIRIWGLWVEGHHEGEYHEDDVIRMCIELPYGLFKDRFFIVSD